MPSGLPAGLPQLVIDPQARQQYPSAMLVECTVSLGVATLRLPHLDLEGTLSGLDLSALAPSLTTLDLSGDSHLLPNTQAEGVCSMNSKIAYKSWCWTLLCCQGTS